MKRVRKIFIWLLISAIIIAVFRRELGIVSINTFLFLDNMLFASNRIPAWLMWTIPGLLIGIVAGAIVAFKKYKLSISAVLIPVLLFLLFTAFMYIANSPAEHESTSLERKTVNGNRNVSVTAEGTLPDNKKISYAPANLLDYNDNTSWICTTNSNGKIDFTFSSLTNMNNAKCIALRIKNGYSKTRKIYNDHNRVQSVSVYINGEQAGTYRVSDSFDQWQEITITPVPVKDGDVLSIRIEAVYDGDKYRNQTALTELFPLIEYYEK